MRGPHHVGDRDPPTRPKFSISGSIEVFCATKHTLCWVAVSNTEQIFSQIGRGRTGRPELSSPGSRLGGFGGCGLMGDEIRNRTPAQSPGAFKRWCCDFRSSLRAALAVFFSLATWSAQAQAVNKVPQFDIATACRAFPIRHRARSEPSRRRQALYRERKAGTRAVGEGMVAVLCDRPHHVFESIIGRFSETRVLGVDGLP